jgi:hypothetical protein
VGYRASRRGVQAAQGEGRQGILLLTKGEAGLLDLLRRSEPLLIPRLGALHAQPQYAGQLGGQLLLQGGVRHGHVGHDVFAPRQHPLLLPGQAGEILADAPCPQEVAAGEDLDAGHLTGGATRRRGRSAMQP